MFGKLSGVDNVRSWGQKRGQEKDALAQLKQPSKQILKQ